MEKIYLNLKRTKQCRKSGGHRTSDGWVDSYRIETEYSLTSSNANAFLSLETCCVFERFLSQHSGSYEYENDRWWNIDEYCNIDDVDISEFINELNFVQNKYEFIQVSSSLGHDARSMLVNSRKEDHMASEIINHLNADLEEEIKSLRKRFRHNILSQTFPHVRNLILKEQLDFFSKYEKLDLYPLDLLAIHKEYDLFIANILKYPNANYEKFTDVYTLLTTGRFSYFDILNGTVPQLNKDENLILSEFLRELEKRFRNFNDQSILLSNYPHPASNLIGLCNLYGYLLNELGADECYKLLDWSRNPYQKEHEVSVFSYYSRFLFPYFIIALLAENKDIEAESLFKKYQKVPGFNDIPFILDARGIYFNDLIPFFNQIVHNQNAIEILSLILHKSKLGKYEFNQIKNHEIVSCKNNFEMCKVFVKSTLHKFITNGLNDNT